MARGRKPKAKARMPAHQQGWALVYKHPLLGPLASTAYRRIADLNGGWVQAEASGTLWYDPKAGGLQAPEWAWVFAHGLLQLGFGHFPIQHPADIWCVACDAACEQFLDQLKFGRRPKSFGAPPRAPARDAEAIFAHFRRDGVDPAWFGRSPAGRSPSLIEAESSHHTERRQAELQHAFSVGLTAAVQAAIRLAGGATEELGRVTNTPAQLAVSWFITNYPLLGAMASSFEIVEDLELARSFDISVAAVDISLRRIYLNPASHLDPEELKFVLAHEMLHAGLRHESRRQGRDPFLWNVACDYVINGWLLEMRVGQPPPVGFLHDAELSGLSAETIYDRIANDLRLKRKLATLAGRGQCDILDSKQASWWASLEGVSLDAFYRRAMAQGLELHRTSGRGLIPAGLLQTIRALSHPPVPWDVELAQWFDHHFAPLEQRRSYARPSRRQASTPHIPRPSWRPQEDSEHGRTFGVVLDTSGSMDTEALGKALGAIATYSAARNVPAARVVFCDAAPYDQGYMRPTDIAGTVEVRGRGGTRLQPGIDLLEAADDFPASGPILVITDGQCDRLTFRRDHALLVPAGASLPFAPRGPVFRVV